MITDCEESFSGTDAPSDGRGSSDSVESTTPEGKATSHFHRSHSVYGLKYLLYVQI